MLKMIGRELQRIQDIIAEAERILDNSPEGKLRCAINKGCYQYYLGKTYLGKGKREFAQKIAQKEYCEKLKIEIVKYERILKQLNDLYAERDLGHIYEELHPGRKMLFQPLVKPVEDVKRDFENIIYLGKPFDENDRTEYYTIKGERVRSKSEKIIADELYRFGIACKYEMPLELKVWNKSIVIYPDFIALNQRTGKQWIIEHLGMMTNMTYYENTMFKLDTYEKNDILIGRDLIILHETSSNPLNTKILAKYIKEYLQ